MKVEFWSRGDSPAPGLLLLQLVRLDRESADDGSDITLIILILCGQDDRSFALVDIVHIPDIKVFFDLLRPQFHSGLADLSIDDNITLTFHIILTKPDRCSRITDLRSFRTACLDNVQLELAHILTGSLNGVGFVSRIAHKALCLRGRSNLNGDLSLAVTIKDQVFLAGQRDEDQTESR